MQLGSQEMSYYNTPQKVDWEGLDLVLPTRAQNKLPYTERI